MKAWTVLSPSQAGGDRNGALKSPVAGWFLAASPHHHTHDEGVRERWCAHCHLHEMTQ